MYYSVTRYLDILTCQNIQIHRPFYIVEEYFTVLMCHNYATNHLLIYRKVKALVTQLYLLLATPWTVACQAPLSMGFSRQEHWSGLPFPSPGDLPDSGIESRSPRHILYYLSHLGSRYI